MDDADDAFPLADKSEASVFGPRPLVAVAPNAVEMPQDGLTDLQRRFCQAFVENGGSAAQAAVAAGYGGGAENMGLRNLAKRKVQEEIARRVKLQAGSALAIAMGGLLKVIEDGDDARAVVSAALGLMDRFGMAPPKGPLIDARTVNVTGQQASAVLQMIAERAAARLAGSSDA